jgi:L-amino acid N-acyltransferase YncA
MKLNKDDVQSLALAALNTFNLTDLVIGKETALDELRDDVITEFEDLNSEETKKARLEHFKIEGTSLEDYSERLLCLDEERKVLYGIRHMGGNRDVPFVQFAPNFPIGSKSEALEIYQSIKSEFGVFNPLYLSFWTRDEIDADFLGSTYMVSTSGKFKELGPWDEESGMAFEDISNDSYYDWYKRGYEEFHADFPDLEKKVTVNSADSMRDSLEQGLLKFVTINGERIGLIAAEKSELLGHDGIYFHEIYIERKWKGKGLAKAIQRKFVEKVTQGHEFIWGTIDSSNLPSYKTAFSNGRRPIRFECFIKLQGELK